MLLTPLLTTSAPPLSGGRRRGIDYVSFYLTKGGEGEVLSTTDSPLTKGAKERYCLRQLPPLISAATHPPLISPPIPPDKGGKGGLKILIALNYVLFFMLICYL